MASAKNRAAPSRAQVNPGWLFLTGHGVEIVLIVGILVCAFALASLFGWHQGDPTWADPGPGRVQNPCGPVGALIADALYGSLGWGAWAIAFPGVLAGLRLAGRDVWKPLRWLGFGLLYVDGLTAAHLLLRPGGAFPPGGLVGRLAAEFLESAVGNVGAWLFVGGEALVLVVLLGDIRPSTVATAVADFAEAQWPKIRAVVVRVGTFVGRLLFGAARAGVKTGVKRVGAGVKRMGQSLARVEGVEELQSATASGASYIEDGDGGELPPSDPTAHAAPVLALAEVQWDETSALPDTTGDGARRTSTKDDVLDMFPELDPRPSRSDPGSAKPAARIAAKASPKAPPKVAVKAPPKVAVEVEDDEDEEDVEDEDVDQDEDEDDLDDDELDDIDDEEDPEADADWEDDDDLAEDEEPADVDPLDAPDPASLPRGATVPPAPVRTGAQRVVVHHNDLLDVKIEDDGEALVHSKAEFELPPLSLLDEVPEQKASFDDAELRRLAILVEEKLQSFKIGGKIQAVRPGPVVTIFEFLPDPGVKVSRIAALQDDLAMALKAVSVRIVAPVPGKGVVGIEIPSPKRMTIYLRELLASPEFRESNKLLPCVLGKDVEGRPMVGDLSSMPHLLVGGTTGSGKSVGVNGMLMSMLFTRSPDELRMLLVDPKKLEFEMYQGIPHLLYPVMTEPKEAAAALAWACREMDDRYEVLARWGVRNIVGYNAKVEKELADWTGEKARKYAPKGWTEDDGPLSMPKKLPYIVIVIDELADLMMVAGKDVEESICRIAQKARACGIHLIVATQRPSVDVVTGLIKANLPTRIAYQLRSRIDSRTILDSMGAEALLGRGDLLYLPPGVGSLMRCHGAFVADDEVLRVTDFLRAQAEPEYIEEIVVPVDGEGGEGEDDAGERDELFEAAVLVCVQAGKASTSLVQRHLKIGYNRAANIIEQMEKAGIVGPADGARPREVLVSNVDLA